MSATVIPFPKHTKLRTAAWFPVFDFWYDLVADMDPNARQATIRRAARCGALSRLDASVLSSIWPEDPGSMPWQQDDGGAA